MATGTGIAIGPWSQTSPPYSMGSPINTATGQFQVSLSFDAGTQVRREFVPGQTFYLDGTQASGATAELPVEVGPYYMTGLYIQDLTTEDISEPGPNGLELPDVVTMDSAGNTVSKSSTGMITLKVERPERLPLATETSSSGVFDVAGLLYDATISAPLVNGQIVPSSTGQSQTTCPVSAYSNVSGATPQAADPTNPNRTNVLVDNTAQDFDPAASGNPGPITFTVNLSACEATGGSGYSWIPGDYYAVAISAFDVDGSAGMAQEHFNVQAG